MNLYLPPDYRPMLPTEGMEDAIKLLKQTFQAELAEALSLRRVTAPLFVFADSGLNDNLNGVERPVSFPIKDMGDRRAEVVHSLAKWKRMKLAAYRIPPGQGLYTDMNAIRADEELDNIHSLYVDQWDWERTIRPEDRTVDFLHDIVRRIYGALLATEAVTHRAFPHIPPTLPREITFVHAEELRAEFPDLSPKEREREAARRYGAVFIRGIGGPPPPRPPPPRPPPRRHIRAHAPETDHTRPLGTRQPCRLVPVHPQTRQTITPKRPHAKPK